MQKEREKLKNSLESCEAKENQPKGFIQWLDYMQKNKPQTNALSLGIMIMVYSGQNIGWGIFNDHLRVQPWAGGYEDEGTIFWAITTFFIATIVGYLIGSLIVIKFAKIKIYLFASILAATSCTCYIIGPDSIYYVFPARIFGGLSHGITYLTLLIHASEVAVPKLRGMIVASAHFCLMIGVFITSSTLMAVYKTRSYEIDPTQIMGFSGLKCIGAGLLIAIFFNRESPVYLLKNYRDEEALNVMMRLRSESHVTNSIRKEFEEFREMIKEDNKSSLNIFKYSNSLIIVLFLKMVVISSFNMPLNNYFLELAKLHFYDAENDTTGMYLAGARWIAMLIGMFLIDFKRIQIFFISSLASGMILLILFFKPVTDDQITSVIATVSFQLFAGLAIGLMSDIYAVDSINTRTKPYFIAFTSIVENLFQILLIVSYFYLKISIYNFIAIFSIFMIIAGICGLFLQHYNTCGLSLRIARNKFL